MLGKVIPLGQEDRKHSNWIYIFILKIIIPRQNQNQQGEAGANLIRCRIKRFWNFVRGQTARSKGEMNIWEANYQTIWIWEFILNLNEGGTWKGTNTNMNGKSLQQRNFHRKIEGMQYFRNIILWYTKMVTVRFQIQHHYIIWKKILYIIR